MTTLREAAQQALDALVEFQYRPSYTGEDFVDRAIAALRAALAEQPAHSSNDSPTVCHAPGDQCIACPHYYGKAGR